MQQQQSGDVAAVVAAADWCSCNRLVHDGRLCIGSRTILSRRRGRGWRVARSHSAPAGSHPTRRAAAPPAGACTRGHVHTHKQGALRLGLTCTAYRIPPVHPALRSTLQPPGTQTHRPTFAAFRPSAAQSGGRRQRRPWPGSTDEGARRRQQQALQT